jgi:hypothetical protein
VLGELPPEESGMLAPEPTPAPVPQDAPGDSLPKDGGTKPYDESLPGNSIPTDAIPNEPLTPAEPAKGPTAEEEIPGISTSKRSATNGLRCCAGARNAATVELTVKGTPGLQTAESPEEFHSEWEPVLRPALGTAANHFARAWKWSPVPNEELVMILGCNTVGPPTCGLAVGRSLEGRPALIAHADVGHATALPDVARIGDARHLRIRGLDPLGTFGRDVTYVYGRVEISKISRP